MNYLISSSIAVVICLAIAYPLYEEQAGKIDALIENNPPVIVVNTVKLLSEMVDVDADKEEILKAREMIFKAIDSFKNAGYIVYDSNAVITAPQANSLLLEDINQIKDNTQ